MTVKESTAITDAVRLTCPLCGLNSGRWTDTEACLQEVLCVCTVIGGLYNYTAINSLYTLTVGILVHCLHWL